MKDQNNLSEKEFLAQYDSTNYARPSVCVDMCVFSIQQEQSENYRKNPKSKLSILLIKRGGHPYLGEWALPGGFAQPDEYLEVAARRELKEETGLEDVFLNQVKTFSKPNRDPRGWVLSCTFVALCSQGNREIVAGDDAQEAEWFEITYTTLSDKVETTETKTIRNELFDINLESKNEYITARINHKTEHGYNYCREEFTIVDQEGIAFDHAQIIAECVNYLQDRAIDYRFVLNLLDPKFKLTDFQKAYELIMQTTERTSAFRRKVAQYVIETDEYAEGKGHRPSKLYMKKLDI